MQQPLRLREIRLPAFKSVVDAVLPLDDLTVLVGLNGSGKSNVLDGVAVLSLLAGGGDIRSAIDGGLAGPAIRGGADGCPPLGSDRFTLGCSVESGAGEHGAGDHGAVAVHLDITVRVGDDTHVVEEHLSTTFRTSRGTETRSLLRTTSPPEASGDISARWQGRKRGAKPPVTFRANQLLTAQVDQRIPATTQAGRDVHDAAAAVLTALRNVFVLDPVPHAMRRYVPARDHRLRRGGENLSAAIASLLDDPATASRLLAATSDVAANEVVALGTVRSELGDVMLTQTERRSGTDHVVPARLMSDGTLRLLAVLAALFEAPAADGEEASAPVTTLVVEEIENGLHPSQAGRVLELVREEAAQRRVQTLATTHSPAVLDAIAGQDHDHVVVCARDEDGATRLTRLTSMPNYLSVIARGSLGAAATEQRLSPAAEVRLSAAELDEFLGVR